MPAGDGCDLSAVCGHRRDEHGRS